MTDVFHPKKRSEVMAKIRSKNTKSERLVFSYLRKNRVYFQKHYMRAPGTPDIALPRKKKAVFIDGDFWHGKTYTKVIQNRASNDYWVRKIKRNMERDEENRNTLQANGWQVITVWESDIKRKRTREQVLSEIRNFLVS